jgi:hypothetical protein
MTVHRNSRRAADARIAAKRQLPGENAGPIATLDVHAEVQAIQVLGLRSRAA